MSHDIAFRNPGVVNDWTEVVAWPEDLRVPVAGELVDLPEHGQIVVESVQWFCDDESRSYHGGRPGVQVIVR